MERLKLLVNKEAAVRDINGRFIFTAPMTDRAKEFNHNEGWKKSEESWLAYRNRTEKERIEEELKKQAFAEDVIRAYNAHYELD